MKDDYFDTNPPFNPYISFSTPISTSLNTKPSKPKIIRKPIRTEPKREVSPFLKKIMKGKEADTKIKLTKQQGKKPDYEDLLAFHNMSEEIEITYGGSNDRGRSNLNQKLTNNHKEKHDYGKNRNKVP